MPVARQLERARVYPPQWAQALAEAMQWPPGLRVERIDQITDQLARAGLARPRSDDAMHAAWQAIRQAQRGQGQGADDARGAAG